MKNINIYIVLVICSFFQVAFSQTQISDSFPQSPIVGPCEMGLKLKSLAGTEIELSNPPDPLVTVEGTTPPAAQGEKRYVHWVHGLNGDKSAWLLVGEAFEDGKGGVPDFLITSDWPEYASGNSFEGNSMQLRNILAGDRTSGGQLLEREENIYVGHSQGGLVGRYLDYRVNAEGDGRPFGGMVTVCSPNQGAQLINNQDMVGSFIRDFAESMAKGPLGEFENSGGIFLRFAKKRILTPEIKDFLLNFLEQDFAEFLINRNYPPITESYRVGAPMINTLNDYNPPGTHIQAFYGSRPIVTEKPDVSFKDTALIEFNGGSGSDESQAYFDYLTELDNDPNINADFDVEFDWSFPELELTIEYVVNFDQFPVPISFATIQWFVNDPNDGDKYMYFKAHQDDHVFALDVFRTRMDYALRVEEAKRGMERCAPWYRCGIGRVKWHRRRRNQYQRGVDFLDRFDEEYRIFIGARYLDQEEVTTDSYCKCVDPNFQEIYVPLDNQGNCDHTLIVLPPGVTVDDLHCWKVEGQTTTETVWKNKPSDGVVLVESQKTILNATEPPYKMPGETSHMQVRNDEVGKNAYWKLLDGDAAETPEGKAFFETQRE